MVDIDENYLYHTILVLCILFIVSMNTKLTIMLVDEKGLGKEV